MNTKKLIKGIQWAFGVPFGMTSIGLFSNADILYAIILLILTILILPVTRDFILKKFPSIKRKYINILLLGIIIILTSIAFIKNITTKVNLDSFEINETYTVTEKKINITGSAKGLDELSIYAKRSIGETTSEKEYSTKIENGEFTIDIPVINIFLDGQEYKTTNIQIDYFGSFTVIRELNEEEQAERDQKEAEKKAKIDDEKAKIKAEEEKYLNSKEGRLCTQNPTWTKLDCERVIDRKYWIGMSLSMLKYNRGTPSSANPSNYGYGTSWQWCWDNYSPSCFYGDDDGIIDSYN